MWNPFLLRLLVHHGEYKQQPSNHGIQIAQNSPNYKGNPGALVGPENGGYYLKHSEASVVAITSDRLCSITDYPYMSLIYNLESHLYVEANLDMEDLRYAGIDVDKLNSEASDEMKSSCCVIDGSFDVNTDDRPLRVYEQQICTMGPFRWSSCQMQPQRRYHCLDT